MKLSIGIVGLPNVGKSTLFNALTQKAVPAENYPFCTIDPSVGVVAVPDERLYKLAEFSQTQKTIPAAVEFVDIAGLVEGASKGEGLGNKFLAHIREVDAILEMVRIFAVDDGKETINHVYGEIDPLRDIKVINMELILADLETVEKRISNLQKDVKRGDKIAIAEESVAKKIHAALLEEKMANTVQLNEDEEKIVQQLNLLTRKKFIYGLNKRSGGKNLDITDPGRFAAICAEIESYGSEWVMIDAKTEHELSDFEGDDKIMMRQEMGHDDDGIDTLIKKSYKLLGLATYFTTGEKETRAWTIAQNSLAPVAAAAIHTDFEKKFIRAEVVFWSDLLDSGSMANAKAKGLVRTEGKEYVVKDGDVIEFKI
ncbi:MAG: redox-regulated ATPase YchF [Candidatus Pacebacteria bacterium]|nr:redox-regulated ATPase YchF [Candidatus Paceibacterota bacterium]